MYDAIDDPYIYKDSTVLINKLELTDQQELDEFEAEISSARAEEPRPEGALDLAHHKAVHHRLFQDVYDWVGKIRAVRISTGSVLRKHRRASHDFIRRPESARLSKKSFFLGLRRQGRTTAAPS
jgi:fido (protein-threonine AMPylation protein)